MNKIIEFISRERTVLASLIISFVLTLTIDAQELPSLKQATNISQGRLSNGIAYYIVKNDAGNGLADVALVQKTGYEDEDFASSGHSVVHARGALGSLPHFDYYTPYDFFTSKYIWPDRSGWAEVRDDATVYRFRNIVLSNGKETLDSALLMIFDIAGKSTHLMAQRYAPANQAIVVAGSVDPKAVVDKMNMLSMFVTKRPAISRTGSYQWNPTEIRSVNCGPSPYPGTAEIVISYSMPRTPTENMGTIQPLVSSKFAAEMSVLIKREVQSAFLNAGVPIASVSCNYASASLGPGDEKFDIVLRTGNKNVQKAISLMGEILSSLDRQGVTPKGYGKLQHLVVTSMLRSYTDGMSTNASYIDKCISSWLYGSTLASEKDMMNFFVSREMDPETGARLFNNYMSAILDKDRNLNVTCMADGVSPADFHRSFDGGWSKPSALVDIFAATDSLSLKVPQPKAKIVQSNSEPMTGGHVWTFNNGITVVWKPVTGTKTFHYSWLVKGGYALVPSLRQGEAIYVDSVPWMYSVSGISSTKFGDMLETNGVSMNFDLSVSDFTIKGAGPSDKLQLLLKSLAAMCRNRSLDTRKYEWFREGKQVEKIFARHSDIGRRQSVDSLLRPASVWAERYYPDPVADDFIKRAGKFFDSSFSRMNDGVFILVGDFDEAWLKKTLTQYIGAFPTDKVSTFRAASVNTVIPGRKTIYKEASEPSVDIELSSEFNYTVENRFAADIAARVLTDRVSAVASSMGWAVDAHWYFEMFPQERCNVYFKLDPILQDGLPSSMLPAAPAADVLAAVQADLDDAAVSAVSAQALNAYKTALSMEFKSEFSRPSALVSVLELRYSYGKDLMSRYSEKIAALNTAKVSSMFNQLASGSMAAICRKHDVPEEIKEPALTLGYPSLPSFENYPDTSSSRVYPIYRKRMTIPSSDSLHAMISAIAAKYEYPVFESIKGPSVAMVIDTIAVADSLGGIILDTLVTAPVDSLFWADPVIEEEN